MKKNKINEIVILVGGRGERLKPLTMLYPKPLLMINGKPFLEILIDSLKGQYTRFILCSWYKSELFDDFIQYYTWKNPFLTLINSVEPIKSGTGGALKNAEKYITGDYFIVINGDTLFDIKYLDYILKEIDYDFLINEVVNKFNIPNGLRILNKKLLWYMRKNVYYSLEDMCEINSKKVIKVKDKYIDIGTFKDYERLREFKING